MKVNTKDRCWDRDWLIFFLFRELQRNHIPFYRIILQIEFSVCFFREKEIFIIKESQNEKYFMTQF